MNSLKILIVEDNIFLGEELQEQLLDFGYTIVDNVSNSKDALKAFRRRLPDLVLCDIQLDGSEKDGIQIAELFNEIAKVPLIFLTAFGDSATVERAKKVNPAYYLIKPCNETQLQVALDFALANFTNNHQADPKHSLRFQQPPSCQLYSSKHFFFVKDGYKYVRIEIADIIWIEALGSTIKIVTENFTKAISSNLTSFSKQIQHSTLQRVHRSYILNLHRVIAYEKGRAYIMYKGEQHEIPIGKSFRDGFQQHFPRLFSQ